MLSNFLNNIFGEKRINTVLLSLIAFSLAFDFRVTTLSILLFAVFTLYNRLKEPIKVNPASIMKVAPFITFYAWFAIGFFYSEDKAGSFKDLETKFSLLALPLLITLFTKFERSAANFIYSAFIIGLIIMELICLGDATMHYLEDGEKGYFFYHQLVSLSDSNAAYFSWLVLFSLVLLLFHNFSMSNMLKPLLLIFQIVFLILLSSRASQLVFFFLILPFAFYYYRSRHRELKYRISFLFAFSIILVVLAQPALINSRFEVLKVQKAKQAFLPEYDHYSYEFNDLSTRLFFWRVGIENIQSANLLFGVGNGDVNQVQNKKMDELGIKDLYREDQPSDFLNMNLHNMYLQSLLASGLIGLFLLLGMLIVPLLDALRTKSYSFLLFQLIVIVFMLHESALQTQAGTVFYSFFSAVLIAQSKDFELSGSSAAAERIGKGISDGIKRLFDIFFSLLFLLPFTLFILPICALIIKLVSPGPVFFIQERTGKDNKTFRCYKLRTMRLNKEADTRQASKNDHRITPFGYFLRVMHIDEFPQLFNVLKGDMSIIGPRPHMLYHTSIYSEELPYYGRRLKVKPGLTGLAQIKGYVGEINNASDLKKRVLNDIYYVKHASINLDLYIFIMTIKNLIGKIFLFKTRKNES